MLFMLDGVPRPNFGICYDPGNVLIHGGTRPKEDLARMADHVRAICLKDAGEGDVQIPLGSGNVDFDVVFGILRDQRFSGPAWVECVRGNTLE